MSTCQLHGENIRKFILAGRAVFTIHNPLTSGRFTYRVNAPRNNLEAKIRFVSVLRGADNTRDYMYIGFITENGFVYGGSKATVSGDAKSLLAFKWFWNHVDNPAPIEVFHEGKCCRCGRALTVPESISMGVGPECAGIMRW